MDFVTVSTAVVLLAILAAWYALLEYEERRQRKDLERPQRKSELGGRKTSRERRQDARGDVARQLSRSNGRRPLTGMSSPTGSGKRLVFQGTLHRYGLAVVSVLLAYLFVTLGNLLFSFPPFIFFGAAVAFTFTVGGRAPGLFAFVLATLLSDFFFVKPTFVFSLDWRVCRLAVFYLLGGLLSVFISKRLTSPTQAH
jgi:K+-sensing histidine kinase KdpD